MVGFFKASGVGIIQSKREFAGTSETTKGKRFYKVSVAFLGSCLDIMLPNEEEYNELNEGDEVQVSGIPDVYQDAISLKSAEVVKTSDLAAHAAMTSGAPKAAPPKQGMFAKKDAA